MTRQSVEWASSFGDDYAGRNPSTPQEMQALYRARFGLERTAMNAEFLAGCDRSARVLEVGCNLGTQLHLLAAAGFTQLYGVEVNHAAIHRSHELNRNLPIWVVYGNALDLPFKDDWFDIVYTSGVLIHISPSDVAQVMREMTRCSRRYVWGFEYFTASGYVEIPYHGQRDMLWKTDFARLFERTCPELSLVKQERYAYLDAAELVDQMYLLEKSR